MNTVGNAVVLGGVLSNPRALLPVGFPTICPAPGLAASIYGYLPTLTGGVLVRPPTP